MEHSAKNIQLIFHHRHALFDGFHIVTHVTTTGILFQRIVHVALDTDVVNHQSFVLTLIHTVHPRNGLYQRVFLQWFVNIHCVETRHVKACYPHRHDDSNLEVRVWILKKHIQRFSVFIRTYQFAQFWIIVLLTSHHQSDALYWCLVFRANLLFPFGAQGNNLFI